MAYGACRWQVDTDQLKAVALRNTYKSEHLLGLRRAVAAMNRQLRNVGAANVASRLHARVTHRLWQCYSQICIISCCVVVLLRTRL
jgi:hypothetical protein